MILNKILSHDFKVFHSLKIPGKLGESLVRERVSLNILRKINQDHFVPLLGTLAGV
jgi:hypothetical protein